MISARNCRIKRPVIGIAREITGRKSPLKESPAMTGKIFIRIQNINISNTEIRKFGTESPAKETMRKTLSKREFCLTAQITLTGTDTRSDRTRLETASWQVFPSPSISFPMTGKPSL